MARKLFEKQANQLVKVNMPREDICNSLELHTAAGLNVKSKIRQPILADGEDEDPENYEQIFEEKFDDVVPDAIVGKFSLITLSLLSQTRCSPLILHTYLITGLMFDNKEVWATDSTRNEIQIPLWEKVLM